MADPKIIPMKIGYSNSYLVKNGTSSVLIDTGVHGFMHKFQKYFSHFGIQFSDIQLVVLTHVHYDHTGNLKELHKKTGAKVAVHKNEFHNLKIGFIRIPSGITPATRVISGIGRVAFPRFTSPPPFEAEIITEEDLDLSDNYGVEGKIIATPGHTGGSQSVIIGNTLIAGDTFLNIQSGLVFPHFVEDPAQLLKTWQKLFDLGIKEVYPGHGAKFRIERAYDDFEKWKKILGKTNRE